MELSRLPRDVLILLALEMDVEHIIKLCQTSSIFNTKICKNNYFWLNKLQKDYGVLTSLEQAKEEHLNIGNLLKKEPVVILESGIRSENIKLVKQAVEHGADLKRKIGLFSPVTLSLEFDKDDIIIYLLEKSNITENLSILDNMLSMIQYKLDPNVRCKMTKKLYSVVLPYFAKINEKKFGPLWRTAPIKLKELLKISEWCITDEFYNKWIPFYEQLEQKYR